MLFRSILSEINTETFIDIFMNEKERPWDK